METNTNPLGMDITYILDGVRIARFKSTYIPSEGLSVLYDERRFKVIKTLVDYKDNSALIYLEQTS